jgi:hypothetical protein
MTGQNFVRKVIYMALAAALLLPLSLLSQPSTVAVAGRQGNPGGILARERDEFKLGQGNLGKIDPAGETIRLATLGMRGVAANLLWSKAEECKLKEDWTGLSATLEQIANLQPNYISVWRFQGWNLSYNISAEWDDYHDRYYWVMKGIEFLEKGVDYNSHEPRLMTDVGWFSSHKIGKSDERLQFRRLFREDDDFHSRQRVHERDNWLFGKEYFLAAQHVVDVLGAAIPTAGPAIFYSRPCMAGIGYAGALEDDHAQALQAAAAKPHVSSGDVDRDSEIKRRLDEIDKRYGATIRAAWEESAREWKELANRELPGPQGEPFRMNDKDLSEKLLQTEVKRLESLAPGVTARLFQEKHDKLPADQRKAFQTPPAERSKEQVDLASLAEIATDVTSQEIAEAAPEANRAEARKVAAEAQRLHESLSEIAASRESVNFDYWQMRTAMEQSADAREARRLLHRALAAFMVDADLPTARRDYEAGFKRWQKVLEEHPELVHDETAFAVVDAARSYRSVLWQLDQLFPKKFVLQSLIDAHEHEF